VDSQVSEEMVQEANTGLDGVDSAAIQVEAELDRGFKCLTLDF
jgi:hypothetical protein